MLEGGTGEVGVMALVGSEGIFNDDDMVETKPVSRAVTFRTMSFLEVKNEAASKVGSRLGAGGNISDWNESAFRGTTNAMGSMLPDRPLVVIL